MTATSDRVTTLIICVGLPASGKSTFAKEWVARDRARRARVNRDTLRLMVDDRVFEAGVTEPRIITAEEAAAEALLRQGISVVVDDTNLPSRVRRNWAKLARRCGADWCLRDCTDVGVEECVTRDAARTGPDHVGEKVIRDLHARFLAGRALPLAPPNPDGMEAVTDPYVPRPDRPRAVLVDLDGTTCLLGDRNPYDETRVCDDQPNPPVVTTISALAAVGHRVVFMSGRTDACRASTEEWLAKHLPEVDYDALYMRAAGDTRRDAAVKAELFDEHVRDEYDVRIVLDDRDQVVRLWRAMGLPCFQVAPGNF